MFETATRVEYKPEIGTQNSEKTAATISSHTRDRKLEIRNQKSETRNQKSEIRNQQLCKFADQQSKNGSFVINQQDSKGNDVHLSTYKGKVLLFVNVASKCGLTNSNYTELNHLYEKYKDQGLEILAFPCNQFGEEEPGSNLEINEFVCTRFKSEFPIFDKVEVNGENAVPVYKFLKSGKWGFFKDDIQWNFSKFLVDKSGKVVDRYYPTTSPLTIEHDIKKLLGVES